MRLLSHVYQILMRFYPRCFRLEFGAEMEAVFTRAVVEKAKQGWRPAVGLVLLELRDWPRAVVHAHWRALRKETPMRDETMENGVVPPAYEASARDDHHPPLPWGEAVLAGVPHVLVALTIQALTVAGAFGLIPSAREGGRPFQPAGVAVFVLGLVVAMGIARRQGWPRWSASWLGYVLLLLIGLVVGALKALEPAVGDWMSTNLENAYASLLLPLLLTIALCALALRNRLRFLLALLPITVLLWTPMLEFSWYPLRTVVVLMAWLVAAGVAVLIARAGRVRTGVWMALALNLVVGLSYTYTRTYHAAFPPEAPAHYSLPPTFLDWVNRFTLGALATSAVVLEPLLVRRLRNLGPRTGSLGVLGFRLSLVGLVLLLAAELAASWWFGSGFLFIRLAWGREATELFQPSVLLYVAILLCLAGVISFGVALARTRPPTAEGTALFLAFVLAAAPLILALPIAYERWDMRAISRTWGYALGGPWVALGTWLVTGRGAERGSAAAA